MNVVKHIICELTGYRPGAVDVSQGDRGSRAVSCRLLENGAPWRIPDGATVRVAYTLPDGTEGLYDALPDGTPAGSIDGNIVTVQIADQLMDQAGMAQVSILVIGPEGGQLATWPIRVMVTANKAARLTVPENMPPYGAGFAGKIYFGGADGTVTPLEIGEGVEIVRQEDGGFALVAAGGGGGIQKETDPTVPDWAKQPQKPPYTAQEVGALPAGTKIPAKTSDLTNDSGFITKSVADLVNYYTKTQTEDLIAQIPKFRVSVVQQLPATGEDRVLYLVPFATAEGQYLEYIWVGGRFEVIGSQRVDLTGYATEGWVQETLGDYLLSSALPQAVDSALAEAQKSGAFDGADGRGIQSIIRTAGNGAAGTLDTYTITYTDGTTSTFQVRNGTNGKDGADGKDGIDGEDGPPGSNGMTPHIGSNGNWYIGSTDTGIRAQGEQGPKGDTGATGPQGPKGDTGATGATGPKGDTGATGAQGPKGDDGADGKTPIKGTDYWTPADQEAIVQQVIAALGTPVFGRVDESNNILLSGELADGTYTLKWLNADGSYTDAGTVTVGKIVTEPTNLFVVGGDGYIESGRCSSTGEDRNTGVTSCFVTNYIDVSYGDVVRIKGYQTPTASGPYCGVKYADGTTGGFLLETDEVVVKDFSLVNGIAQFTVNAQNADFMRFTILKPGSLDDIVITVNEPLE